MPWVVFQRYVIHLIYIYPCCPRLQVAGKVIKTFDDVHVESMFPHDYLHDFSLMAAKLDSEYRFPKRKLWIHNPPDLPFDQNLQLPTQLLQLWMDVEFRAIGVLLARCI